MDLKITPKDFYHLKQRAIGFVVIGLHTIHILIVIFDSQHSNKEIKFSLILSISSHVIALDNYYP